MRILEEIKRDHDKARELFLQIENKEDMGPEIFGTLVAVLLAHHEAEEQTVFPQLGNEQEEKELRLELIAEHDALRRGLQVVLDTDPEDDNWKARVMVCKEMLNHHIQEEEKELFEKLRNKLSENQLTRLFDNFKQVEDKRRPEAERMAADKMILRPQDHLPKNPLPLGGITLETEQPKEGGRASGGSKSGGESKSGGRSSGGGKPSGEGKSAAGSKSTGSKSSSAGKSGGKPSGGSKSSGGSKKSG